MHDRSDKRSHGLRDAIRPGRHRSTSAGPRGGQIGVHKLHDRGVGTRPPQRPRLRATTTDGDR
jgi:hypothetical protein